MKCSFRTKLSILKCVFPFHFSPDNVEFKKNIKISQLESNIFELIFTFEFSIVFI